MRQLVVVEELDSVAQLVRDMTHVIHRVRLVVIVLKEIEHAEAENFKSNTCVSVVVEPVQDLYAQAKKKK